MKYAWIEGGKVRDVASGDPAANYHPDVAKLYDTLVPDEARNGDGWDGTTLAPAPVPEIAVVAAPAPTRAEYSLAFTAEERSLYALFSSQLEAARKG